MTNLENAKRELSQVGKYLSMEMKVNPSYAEKIRSLLISLKHVNTSIENLINGDDFSFDEIEEAPKMKESTKPAQNDFGVDLGNFNNFINQKSPDSFDWRSTFREANGNSGSNVEINMNDIANSDFNEDTLGRMVDNTPASLRR